MPGKNAFAPLTFGDTRMQMREVIVDHCVPYAHVHELS